MEKMRYNLEDKPKALHMFLYGIQWFTAILPFLIILSGVVAGLHSDDLTFKTIFSQKTFIITGFALIVQILMGHKLPILIGPATILLIGLTNTLNLSLAASYTAMAIGGLMIILLSFGKLFNYLQKLFTTRVVVVTLLLVAVTILPLVLKLSIGENGQTFFNVLFSIVLALIMIFANCKVQGVWKSLVILAGLAIGSIIYLLKWGVPTHESMEVYNWQMLADNLIITPEFNLSAIIAFIFCFLALTVNELGAVQATAQFIGTDNIAQRSKRGIRVSGIFNTLSGITGVIGVVDYSMSPGIISATQSASRFPLILSGAILIICALIPQSLYIFSYIPTVVMGSVLLYVMCSQLSSGLQMMTNNKAVTDFNQAVTVSFPVMVGILISFAPPAFADSIPNLLKPIIGNGFIMGIISVLLLEHVFIKHKA